MSANADFTVEEVVAMLSLKRQVDGSWGRDMGDAGVSGPQDAVSAYRLLTPQGATWRMVAEEELWTAYMGAPLQIELTTAEGTDTAVVEPGGQWLTVPPGGWLRLTPLGDWCLAGRIGKPEARPI